MSETDWALIDFDEPKRPAPVQTVPKGTCPKCGEHIGRGLHFHVKACDGTPRGD